VTGVRIGRGQPLATQDGSSWGRKTGRDSDADGAISGSNRRPSCARRSFSPWGNGCASAVKSDTMGGGAGVILDVTKSLECDAGQANLHYERTVFDACVNRPPKSLDDSTAEREA